MKSFSALSRSNSLVVLAVLFGALAGCKSCRKPIPVIELPEAAAPDLDASTVDAAVAEVDAEVPDAATPVTGPTTCKKTLKVGTLKSSGGITDKDLASGSLGTLFVPCGGGAGPARAVFGKHTFTGSVGASGNLTLSAGSVYNALGCPWQTSQTIAGTPPNLSFHYGEKVVPPCKSNAKPTTLDGAISVQ